MRKNYLIWIICLVTSCSPQPVCHSWTSKEIAQLKREDAALAPDAKLHALIRDYESICAE